MKSLNLRYLAMKSGLAGVVCTCLLSSGYCAAQALPDGDRGDATFIEDLARVRSVAKQRAKKNGTEPLAVDSYVTQQLEKYGRFNKFAKEKMAPHSKAIAAGRTEPEKLLAAGEVKLAENKDSWEGHDFVATAKLFKKDTKGAIASYSKALETAPEEMRGWYDYMLGVTSLMGSDREKALEWLDKAIEDNNNWMAVKGAHLNKAAILAGKSSFEKAAASLDAYFAMARESEAKIIAGSPICQMMISAGVKAGGCGIK